MAGFAQVDATSHDLWASPGGLVVGDLANSGAQLFCCVDQVQVGPANRGGHLAPPAGDVSPSLLSGGEGGSEAVLVGVRFDVACAGAGVQDHFSAADARVATRRDTHGTTVTSVRLEIVPKMVEFRVAAVIQRTVSEPGPLLRAGALKEPAPAARHGTDDGRPDSAGTGCRASGGRPRRPRLRPPLRERVKDAITYEIGVTSTWTTAAEAYAGGRGVCQDHAHVMLALCRSVGLPARRPATCPGTCSATEEPTPDR